MKKIVMPARDGRIDDHFGHCEYYVIYTVSDTGEVIEREEMPSPQGCGCKSGIASEFKSKGITLMLAGNMGAGALNKLSSQGIEVIRGCSGALEDVLAAYLQGQLADSGLSCSHHEEGHVCSHGDAGHDGGKRNSGDGHWHIA